MDFILTNKGASLLAKVVGGAKLIFTRAISSDDISNNVIDLVSISNKKQDLQLNNLIEKEGLKGLSITLTNLELKASYRLRQIGIFAKVEGNEEVLFLVGQDEVGEKIPSISEGEIEFNYEVLIKNSGNYQMDLKISGNDFVRKDMIVDNLVEDNADKNKVLSARAAYELKDKLYNLDSEIEKIMNIKKFVIPIAVEAWKKQGDYYQVTIKPEIIITKEEDFIINPQMTSYTSKEVKDYLKNFSYIFEGTTYNGKISLLAYKKPSVLLAIEFRGV